MALLPLYLDAAKRTLVKGISDSATFGIGALTQEDTLILEVHLLKRVSYLLDPLYSQEALAGYSLTVSLGSANDPIAQQTSFSLSADGYSMTGNLGMNTSGINALADNATTIFEVRFSVGGGYYSAQQIVSIKKAVALAGAVSDPPGDTGLGVNQATGMFLPKNDVSAFTMLSQDASKRVLVYVHNDGSFRTELIS